MAGLTLLVAVPAKKTTTDHVVSALRVMDLMISIADLDYWGEDPAEDELANPSEFARIVAVDGKGGKAPKGKGKPCGKGHFQGQMPVSPAMGYQPQGMAVPSCLPGMAGPPYQPSAIGAPAPPLAGHMPDLPPSKPHPKDDLSSKMADMAGGIKKLWT